MCSVLGEDSEPLDSVLLDALDNLAEDSYNSVFVVLAKGVEFIGDVLETQGAYAEDFGEAVLDLERLGCLSDRGCHGKLFWMSIVGRWIRWEVSGHLLGRHRRSS